MPLRMCSTPSTRVGARDLAHAAPVVGRAVELHRRLRRGERVDAALAVEPDDLRPARPSSACRRRRSPACPSARRCRSAGRSARPRSPRASAASGRRPSGACRSRPTIARGTRRARSRAAPSRPSSSRARAPARGSTTRRTQREPRASARASDRPVHSPGSRARPLVLDRVLLGQRPHGGACAARRRRRRSSPAAPRRAATSKTAGLAA